MILNLRITTDIYKTKLDNVYVKGIAMDANERIAELENRLTHQERHLEEMNDALFQQWKTIEALKERIRGLDDKLQAAIESVDGDTPREPPPPHY
ncbi:MAG: SlyX family protein [Rhodospirillales bacterium]|nr:SlyX family protein [Rhodospirillales bacterium]MCW8861397.1 SlyX family protein [Rhodospirillales bacterium]MCW8971194.1 SlyX family protein [Rhodospirillales bacterium]MCW9002740.1 SlyX family protein [Rhodospirillales bacterium]MCW9039140.1 SlyX family protein [Rhodospirillales bacterium]